MFSFCPPSLPIENMQLQGLPDQWANILMFVWGHHVRWLCLGKAVHPTPEHVQTYMPQVDAIAPRLLSGCSLGLFMMCLPFQTCVRVHTIMIALWACAMFASIDGAAGVPLWVSVKCSKMCFIAGTALRKQEINDAEFCECLRPATRVLGIDFEENVFIIPLYLRWEPFARSSVCRSPFAEIAGCPRYQDVVVQAQNHFTRHMGRLVWTIAAVTDASCRKAWHARESYVSCWVWATMSSIRTMRQVRAPWRRMPRPGGWHCFICAGMRELNWEFCDPWVFADVDLGHEMHRAQGERKLAASAICPFEKAERPW